MIKVETTPINFIKIEPLDAYNDTFDTEDTKANVNLHYLLNTTETIPADSVKRELEDAEDVEESADDLNMQPALSARNIISFKYLTLKPCSIKCETCPEFFQDNVSFGLHFNESQAKATVKRCSCHLCGCKLNSYIKLENHIREHESSIVYECAVCGKTFQTSREADKHKPEHFKDPRLDCKLCGRSCPSRHSLRFHMETKHSGGAKHPCDLCAKSFPSVPLLKRHRRTHGRNFVCELCGQTFATNVNLQRHKKLHGGVKEHGCEVCGRRFAKKDTLVNHRRVHTGERPFKCKVCGKEFRQRSVVTLHEMTHTGRKPHNCRMCGKGFNKAGQVKTHEAICSKKE